MCELSSKSFAFALVCCPAIALNLFILIFVVRSQVYPRVLSCPGKYIEILIERLRFRLWLWRWWVWWG